jgi:PHP family Zn ribbon phosphoesterase
MFIPAHIDKSKTSVISQLGFIPFDLEYEAVEITKHTTKEAIIQQHKYLKNKPFIRSSDAHQPDQIGTNTTQLTMPTRNFEEIKKAILALAND